jgi:DNA-binding winged helix-turn-helix (wHTH) protein/Tol biopolymer transport system component
MTQGCALAIVPGPVFRFGPFKLLVEPSALYRDGHPVAITPKALATLTALVSRQGDAISKVELLSTVWSGTAVEEANLSQNVYTLRKLLAPDFPGQNLIENIPRFGYRFNLPVEEVHEAIEQNGHPLSSTSPLSPPISPEKLPDALAPYRFHLAAGAVVTLVVALLLVHYAFRESEDPPRPYNLVQVTANDTNNRVTSAAPSPDGEQVAYADDDGLMLRARKGGLAHPLRAPELYEVTRIAWFPDGLHLAVSGQDPKSHAPAVWSVSVTGDAPALLKTDAANAIPSPDGKRIAFEANRGKEIWVSGPDGTGARLLLTAPTDKALSLLVWSRNGAELYVSRHNADHNYDYPGKAGAPGEFLAIDAASATITAQKNGPIVDEACLLAGDQMLFAGVEGNPRLYITSFWKVALDPRSGAFRSPPRPVQTLAKTVRTLSSSRNGSVIDAVISSGEADVYVATLEPHDMGLRDIYRLTYDVSSSYPHSWTRDSRAVLFESIHTGINQIYRQDIDSRNPSQLISTPYESAGARTTPDGRWIFFAGGDGPLYHKLFRVSSNGGSPTEINLTRGIGQFRCPLLRGSCVLRQEVGNQVVFSRLDPFRGEGAPFYSRPKAPRESDLFGLSPDGTQLAMSLMAGPSNVIRVAKFDRNDKLLSSSDVITRDPTDALQWSADGKGWFTEVPSPTRASSIGNRLYFVDLSGKEKLLGQSNGKIWGIPSPDGKKLAMVEATSDSNIWSMQ